MSSILGDLYDNLKVGAGVTWDSLSRLDTEVLGVDVLPDTYLAAAAFSSQSGNPADYEFAKAVTDEGAFKGATDRVSDAVTSTVNYVVDPIANAVTEAKKQIAGAEGFLSHLDTTVKFVAVGAALVAAAYLVAKAGPILKELKASL